MDSFLTFINQQGWNLSNQRSLLTVSGGVDSVVLAHLFHQHGFPAAIAHCNFQLRGADSEADEQFVSELAAYYGFAFFSKAFDTKVFAKHAGISTQMAARELRYTWFEEVSREHGFDWVVTAHHSSDSLETSLLNLVRGTGLPGLKGIAPQVRNVIRPLLPWSKDLILKYAEENGLKWREDVSNSSVDYRRNKIRHEVIPVLREINPSIESTFNDTAERLRASEHLLKSWVLQWEQQAVRREEGLTYIAINEVLTSKEPAFLLWSVLQEKKFTYAQIKSIVAVMGEGVGKVFDSESHTLLVDRADLVVREKVITITKEEVEITELSAAVETNSGILVFQEVSGFNKAALSPAGNSIAVDLNKLEFPLRVRTWERGDVFCPFGMNGRRKKLSDLLIDLKLDRFRKENVSVLQNGNGEIIWVLGLRSDERYRVEDFTSKILLITISEGADPESN